MKLSKRIKSYLQKYSDYNFNRKFRVKVAGILANHDTVELTGAQKNKIKQYYATHHLKISRFDWHRLFTTIYGEFSEKYVPEDIYYTVLEPFYNKSREFNPALLDKNLLSKIFKKVEQPKTIVKNVNGSFVTESDALIDEATAINLIMEFTEFIIKPSINSGGGRKVTYHNLQKSDLGSTEEYLVNLLGKYGKDFIVQQVVQQNSTMKTLNPTSINTIRVLSFLHNNEIEVLSSYVRMGGKGSYADNVSAGGLCCGVQEDGSLQKFGRDADLKTATDNKTGFLFENFKIPFYKEIREEVKRLHQCIPYFKLVSWDIALNDNDQIVLIEYNTIYQEINAHQVFNGPVLEPLIDFYRANSR